jgi:hypothetical protein
VVAGRRAPVLVGVQVTWRLLVVSGWLCVLFISLILQPGPFPEYDCAHVPKDHEYAVREALFLFYVDIHAAERV